MNGCHLVSNESMCDLCHLSVVCKIRDGLFGRQCARLAAGCEQVFSLYALLLDTRLVHTDCGGDISNWSCQIDWPSCVVSPLGNASACIQRKVRRWSQGEMVVGPAAGWRLGETPFYKVPSPNSLKASSTGTEKAVSCQRREPIPSSTCGAPKSKRWLLYLSPNACSMNPFLHLGTSRPHMTIWEHK